MLLNLMRRGIVYYVGHSERGGWGEQVYTPLPSIQTPWPPLALGLIWGRKQVETFLGQEGDISVHLPNYYIPLLFPVLRHRFIKGCQIHSQGARLCAWHGVL